MIVALPWTARVGEPEDGSEHVRHVSLYLSGIEVFGLRVYDTNAEGARTPEMAVENALRVFSSRLGAVLDEPRSC